MNPFFLEVESPFSYISKCLDIVNERYLDTYDISEEIQLYAIIIYLLSQSEHVGWTKNSVTHALQPLIIYDYVAWFRQLVLDYLVGIMLIHLILSAH